MRYVIGMFVCVIILTLTSGAAFVLSVEGGGGFLLLLSIGCCALRILFCTRIFRVIYRVGLEEGELRGTGDLGLALQWRREETEDWELPKLNKRHQQSNEKRGG